MPQLFVAQVNISEATADIHRVLGRESGMISFFASIDPNTGVLGSKMDEVEEQSIHRLLGYDMWIFCKSRQN